MNYNPLDFRFDEKIFDNDHLSDELKEYLSSPEFEKDSLYWKSQFKTGQFFKFYNIKSNDYKSKKIKIDFDKLGISNKFNFTIAIFSLYLSRIDKSKGCLLKTILPTNDDLESVIDYSTNDLNSFDRYTLLKFDNLENISFSEHLDNVVKVYDEAVAHTKISVENYVGDMSFYSIYDLTDWDNESNSPFALAMNVFNNHLELSYNSGLFSDIYIEHMLENIKSLIYNLNDCPNQPIAEIDILSDNEKSLLSKFSKGKTVATDKNQPFSEVFRQNAIDNPKSIAIDDGINQISYGQLEKSSNSIAYDLCKNYGIGLGDSVALMLPRNYHFPELVLSLNKIGASFVPIDTSDPIKRIEHMLNISKAKSIVTSKDIKERYDFNIDMICIEDLNADDEVNLEIKEGNDLFAIMFTSGTIGLPKGVKVSNDQIPGQLISFKSIFRFSSEDVLGCYLSFNFIASYAIFVALYHGACCRIFNEEEQKDSLLLIKALKENHMNSLVLPPSVGIPIFENEEVKLDYLALAGAKIEKLSKKNRHTKLINIYGTTETIITISKTYDLKDIADGHVSLGKPTPNTWVYILDENDNEMPIGVSGEICVSSKYISPGYYNDDDLSREVFVENPHSNCEGNKQMYRTGDIGFFNFDGEIEIIGRKDDQLSVRGFRIESKEILNIVKRFSEISDIYLDVDCDNLIAYYVLDKDCNLRDFDIKKLKEALKMELPHYMVPSLFIELDSIHLNTNGKIDKSQIKEEFSEKSSRNIADEVLSVVVDGFKDVLNLDHVLINDDFVALGGNSLSAMKLQVFLKETLNVSLSSNEIIELSTPANISNQIKFDSNSRIYFDTEYDFDGLCPLSESQWNVYLDETSNDLGTTYNNPFKLSFRKKYSSDAIQKMIGKLLKTYPILLARIVLVEDDILLNFDSSVEIDAVSYEDISSNENSQEIQADIEENFVRPFDLNRNLARFLIVENKDSTILYIDLHHLIFDASSLNIILNNLDSLMEEDIDFNEDNGFLRQLSFEEGMLKTDYLNEASSFFDSMLADLEEVSDLMPSVNSEARGNVISALDIDKDKFIDFLKSKSITSNQFFASVFAYALSRFTGSSKVIFNLIEDGRGHIDLSNSIGMFVRTVPLLIDCRNQKTSSFLRNSSSLINSAMKYDLYPFRELTKKYDFDSRILFQYINAISKNDDVFSLETLSHDEVSDLLFYVYHSNEQEHIIKVSYSDKFDVKFIKSFIDVFERIIHEIMDADCLADINYLSTDDLEFLESFNQNDFDREYDDILDAFNDNLSKYPEGNLVCFKDHAYSYSQGAFIASKIADELKNLKVSPGECVSFLLRRSEWYLFTILAILSNGNVFVPLDSSLPDERLIFMVEDSASRIIIVDDSTYERAEELFNDSTLLNLSKINLHSDTGKLGKLSKLPVRYNDLACILYTSGTTGLPKGVKNTRKSILNVCAFYKDRYGLDENDVYGLFSAIGFDVTIFVINAVLYSGACLSIVPEEIRLDMHRMNEYFKSQNVSHAFITTQVSKLFMNSVDCDYLDLLLVIGEKLGEFDNSGDYLLVDAYGPTEAFAFVSAIENNEKLDYSSVGLIDYNMKSYVLDDELRRVPVGAVGELYLSGDQLADGYLNRPEKTAEAFLLNPFESDNKFTINIEDNDNPAKNIKDNDNPAKNIKDNDNPAKNIKDSDKFTENIEDNDGIGSYDIMYRTGDMVRVLDDGTIGFIGRRDTQVKIRGNRLELGEVEAVIRQLDYVEDLTVQTIKNGENNELIAYLVCPEEYDTSIKEHISQNKPDYMVPTHMVYVDEIPLNANGKVDKKALLDIGFDKSKKEYIAPRTDVEKDIVSAFEKAFNMSKISLLDDFTNLGGDSLIAIKLISYLNEYNVSAADIMSLRTPKAIADNIKGISFDWNMYSLKNGCPLNESQLNIYLDIAAKKEVDSYFIPFIIKIPKGKERIESSNSPKNSDAKGKERNESTNPPKNSDAKGKERNESTNPPKINDAEEIADVLNKIFMVHPICSMCVSDDFEIPHLVRGRTPSISIESNMDEISIYRFLAEPFNLHDSLCRFLIVENDDEYVLYSVFHHIIFDERSIHVFKHDFKHILQGASINLHNSSFNEEIVDLMEYSDEELIDLDSDYIENSLEFDDSFLKVSAFNTQIKNTEEFKEAREFFDSMLCDVEDIGLFLEDPLPDGPGFASYDLDFDSELFEKFIKENSISEYVLFVSTFSYTLSRFVGSDKVLFCIDDHGRDRFNNFNSIGMFVNTLPLLVDIREMEIPSFVEYMSKLVYNVLRYNYCPFRDLSSEHNFNVDVLFQYFPIWLNKDDMFFNVDNKIINNIADFNMDLMININQKTDGYTLNVQYSSKYSHKTIKRFMETYNLVLSQIISVEKLSDIELVSPSDLRLLDTYNETESPIEYDDILDAFNANLNKRPNNMLVSYNDINFTYGEGAFIASEIASRLRDAGIGPGDFVPFLVPRSHWYLLINLGILSAGAIYVPLDEIHPDERLRFILNDIDSRILLVSDETCQRAESLADDLILINVSSIIKGDIGALSYLDYEYDELVSVHYTSGTTGVPKGVLGKRKAISNLCQYYIDNYHLSFDDVYGLYTAIGFDVSIFVIAVSIYAGACLSVIPEDVRLNMDALNEYFLNQNITHSFITTPVGKLFMENIDETSLDVLFVIGEKLGDVESPEGYQLVDSYGPTETFNFTSQINNSQKIDPSSIGYPAYNMKVYVLDNEMNRLPIGAVGELYLSGRQMAKGYLNRDEETSYAFLDNPFEHDGDYTIMYRTGDMVRILPDGSLGIIGRRDSQVKIRGNRVELGEVESVIRELSFVKDVSVQTIKNGDNNELVAYLVYDENLPVVKSVQDHIRERKPEYMIPSFVIDLEEIPLNVNGKVDKNALPKVELESLHADYVPPTTETEKIVADAFKEIFNQEKIGIYDDFVLLGGDSLSAIKLTSILSKSNIEFNARKILVERTPYRIGQLIDYADCDNSCNLIKRGSKEQSMFLIPPMTGFSFEYSNLVHSFDFEGNVYAIDDPKFKLSLDEIKGLENHGQYTLDEFYRMIKDIFKNGDILVGYSSGGIFAMMLAEKLENDGKIAKIILIDGLLSFKEVLYTREKLYKDALEHWKHHEFDFIVGTERKGAKFEKFVEITLQNVNIDFDEPRLNSEILYLSTGELFSEEQIKEKLDSLSPNNEIKLIDSTNHSDILKVDYNKLVPYFNGD